MVLNYFKYIFKSYEFKDGNSDSIICSSFYYLFFKLFYLIYFYSVISVI